MDFRTLAFVMLTCGGLAAILLLRTTDKIEEVVAKAEKVQEKKKESKKVLTELQATDREPLRIPEEANLEITRDCQDELAEILGKDIDAEAFVDLPSLVACPNLPSKVASAILVYQEACRNFFASQNLVQTTKVSLDCRAAFFDLRQIINCTLHVT